MRVNRGNFFFPVERLSRGITRVPDVNYPSPVHPNPSSCHMFTSEQYFSRRDAIGCDVNRCDKVTVTLTLNLTYHA